MQQTTSGRAWTPIAILPVHTKVRDEPCRGVVWVLNVGGIGLCLVVEPLSLLSVGIGVPVAFCGGHRGVV